MGVVTINAVLSSDTSPDIGTSCQICDSFIPIAGTEYYPRICDECKRRLKKLLYEPPEEDEQ